MKPMLFNTKMVRAILDNRKTVTRRLVRHDTEAILNSPFHKKHPDVSDEQIIEKLCEPPCKHGDILYIRETYCWCPCWDCGMDTDEHNCCDKTANKFFNHGKGEWGCYGYKASFADNEYPSVDKWHPSIHMPKEAARIFLKVKNVRAERLKDIDDKGAYLEGAGELNVIYQIGARVCEFAKIWNSTIKPADINTYGWDANPWVWVIEFERITKEQAYELESKKA